MGAREHQGAVEAWLVAKLWHEHFAPQVPLPVDAWADANRVLPKGSAEPGPWRTSRTPYSRQIMQDLSDDSPHEDIVLMTATQLVKSEAGLNWLGSIIDQTPGPVMVVQPTIGLGERYSKQRIAPMIKACPTLHGKVKDSRLRDSGNTVLMKEFPGGILVITGSESAAGLASMPARFIHFDERDDYPDDVEGQGDPLKVATARQDTFRRRKRLTSSSPKRAKGLSRIEQEFEAGTRFRYHVPCPHCGEKQALIWAGLRWINDDPSTVRYTCKFCGALIPEEAKTALLAAGEWIAENPGAKVRSYHLSSLYSPYGWLPWADLVRQWIAAIEASDRGDFDKLKAFLNTRLAETWEEQAEKIAAAGLKEGAEDFPLGVVPMGASVVVTTVDVQDNRFEIASWGFGANDSMWLFDYVVLPADPGNNEDWDALDGFLKRTYPHAGGAELRIRAAAIDTGGHFTHEVYRYVRKQASGRRIAAIKGGNRPAMPIFSGKPRKVDVNSTGGVIEGGVELWEVGVNTAKDILFARLKRTGQVHLSKYLPDAVFDQLTAEHRVKHRTARGMQYVWKPKREGIRNEAWDLAVYALWCGERLALSKRPPSVWEAEMARLLSEKPDEPTRAAVAPLRATPPAVMMDNAGSGQTGARQADTLPIPAVQTTISGEKVAENRPSVTNPADTVPKKRGFVKFESSGGNS